MSLEEEANLQNPIDLADLPPPVPFRTSEAERQAIIAERLAGVSVNDIAKRYGINPATVWRICKKTQETAAKLADDWRSKMRHKAIRGVNAGLDATDDPYKRAGIGVQVLKGLGDFRGDTDLNVVTLVSSSPAGLERVIDALPIDPTVPQPLPPHGETV
jgi:AcrR family transcriptional regulator